MFLFRGSLEMSLRCVVVVRSLARSVGRRHVNGRFCVLVRMAPLGCN